MEQLWWYLSRSSGIVATVLIVAALIWGFFFSARATGNRRKPNWWLDLHNYLGGLAFVFTMVHLISVYQDAGAGLGLTQVLVPFTVDGWTGGITWGVIATYLFALVVFTSWPRRLGSRRTWLAIHLLSVPGALLAGAHAWMVGSSGDAWWFRGLLALLAGLAVYPAVLRLFSAAGRFQARQTRRRHAPPSRPAPPVDADRPHSRELVGASPRSGP